MASITKKDVDTTREAKPDDGSAAVTARDLATPDGHHIGDKGVEAARLSLEYMTLRLHVLRARNQAMPLKIVVHIPQVLHHPFGHHVLRLLGPLFEIIAGIIVWSSVVFVVFCCLRLVGFLV